MIVFANGCFDLLHEGHLHLLREAKALGGRLIVAINSDVSIRRIKGRGRPVESQAVRAQKLRDTGIADEVLIFETDTPEQLIRELRPAIIVKGSDARGKPVPGESVARVHFVERIPGFSTTEVIDHQASLSRSS